MREIKFRGKTAAHFPDDKNNVVIPKGKWITGGIAFDEDRVWIDIPFCGQIIVDKNTVGQYTGLKDKNGKEIYEGDIVKFKYYCRTKEFIAPIKYGEWQQSKCDEYDCAHYGYYLDFKWENYCENTGLDLYEINEIVEVVGNIYDNPELLKEEHK